MSTVPTWLGATAGNAGQAGQVNQFLGTHTSQELYAATLMDNNTTNGAGAISGQTLYLAQQFTTGASQTAIGYILLPINTTTTTGTSLGPTTIGIYANSGGAPTGSALVSVTLTAEYAYNSSSGAPNTSVRYPVPVTGLTPSTTYWIVLAPTGTASFHYTWFQSTAVSGASTSTNGTTWSAQAYGLRYRIFDQTVSGLLTHTWEDSGARWTTSTYTAAELLSTYAEYTVAQGTNGYVQGYRTLTYSGGLLTGVA